MLISPFMFLFAYVFRCSFVECAYIFTTAGLLHMSKFYLFISQIDLA